MRDTNDQDQTLEGHGLFDFYVQQLEEYLDGELNTQEAQDVRRRLAEEPAYAAALDRLHRERAARVVSFEAIETHETDPAAVARLVASARRMSLQGRLEPAAVQPGHSFPTWVKITMGAAACVLVGFGGFLFGGYDLGTDPATPSPTPYSDLAPGTDAGNRLVLFDEDGKAITLPAGTDTSNRLVILDENGKVILSQPMEKTPFGQPPVPPAEQIIPRDPTFNQELPR